MSESGSGQSFDSIHDQIFKIIPKDLFVVPKQLVDQTLSSLSISMKILLYHLAVEAKRHCLTPISSYNVGVAAKGTSGNIYIGVNMEFVGLPLICCIHSEQFSLASMMIHGDCLEVLATTTTPCGHCRQFLKEVYGEDFDYFKIQIEDTDPVELSNLLPRSFGPSDLREFKNRLLRSDQNTLKLCSSTEDKLVEHALMGANKSYSLYTDCQSGVAIKTSDGKVFSGSYLESAAYNPSLSPLHVAIVNYWASIGGKTSSNNTDDVWSKITDIVLVEKPRALVSQKPLIEMMKSACFPKANFKVCYAEP